MFLSSIRWYRLYLFLLRTGTEFIIDFEPNNGRDRLYKLTRIWLMPLQTMKIGCCAADSFREWCISTLSWSRPSVCLPDDPFSEVGLRGNHNMNIATALSLQSGISIVEDTFSRDFPIRPVLIPHPPKNNRIRGKHSVYWAGWYILSQQPGPVQISNGTWHENRYV